MIIDQAKWKLNGATGPFIAALLCALFSFAGKAAHADPLRVFAAASLTNVLQALDRLGQQEGLEKVNYSFSATGVLARQIELGAPADLFVAADKDWMDYAIDKDLVLPNTRIDFASNRLVAIVPAMSTSTIELSDAETWRVALGGRPLAIADPDYVPAGRYAKQALKSISVWPTVKSVVLGTENVRLALVAVERGEANLGIVYATDAAVSQKVRTLMGIPTTLHEPIRYPMAVVRGRDTPKVRELMSFLTSIRARQVLQSHGFRVE